MGVAPPPAWVYMLRLRDGRLYTGWAVDPLRRLQAHLAGRGSRLVRALKPAVIVYLEPATGSSAALQREAAIKRLARKRKQALVADAAPATARWLRRLGKSATPAARSPSQNSRNCSAPGRRKAAALGDGQRSARPARRQ